MLSFAPVRPSMVEQWKMWKWLTLQILYVFFRVQHVCCLSVKPNPVHTCQSSREMIFFFHVKYSTTHGVTVWAAFEQKYEYSICLKVEGGWRIGVGWGQPFPRPQDYSWIEWSTSSLDRLDYLVVIFSFQVNMMSIQDIIYPQWHSGQKGISRSSYRMRTDFYHEVDPGNLDKNRNTSTSKYTILLWRMVPVIPKTNPSAS